MGLTGQGVPGGPELRLGLRLGPGVRQGQQQWREQQDPSLGCQDQAGCEGSYFSEPLHSWPFLGDPL